ncbi:MAG: phosphoribosylanthranilate isomerase [Saprospiraceae bacterium]|nr:phosphoribosylanthranilate isomerase [Saprospiraceae bacterium]
MKPKVKICCISSEQEALDAIRFGAAALGLVGKMPSGPGPISDEQIRSIAAIVPPPIGTFLLTSEVGANEIIEHHRRVHTSTIQIVDALAEGTYHQIRAALPSVKLVQVIHVVDESSVEEALSIAHEVDAILLDSGNPNLAVKELGGTGRVHDWGLSRRICESVSKPVFLAGGLRPDNVRRAIDLVQPYGLDLCSGVRTNGRLDLKKLEAFFEEVEKA